jgi:CNT family concentrative nucleoside transporter
VLVALGDFTGVNSYFVATYNQPLNLQLLFGIVLQFVAYGIGVSWTDALNFGSLLGTKITLNEFVAYLDLGKMIELKKFVDEKSVFMATYALCGFANFSSIAIQIGGLSPLAPERRGDFAKLGLKAVLGGALSTLLTATLAGILF